MCNTIEVNYCMEKVLIFVKVLCNAFSEILNVVFKLSRKGICVDPQALAVITVSGETFHPLF